MIKSWMVIGAVAFAVFLLSALTSSSDIQWFRRLRRPSWLTFEAAIPIIWTVIFICAAWSAVIVWEAEPGTDKTWLLMGLYLLLEIATMAYTPVMLKMRSLRVGTVIGATGLILCLMLILSVWKIDTWAGVLLLPYVLWSPIGTYTTWQMTSLNPEDA
ncbi:MAG: TspO/MBR family protein [Cyanobacteriota bacterium]|nr:TspO/MBR family protein [Cyanobacteriota bacterium]